LKDKFENLGARLVQDVASKTNEVAGDGTTSATVLARAIFSETVKNVAAGCNPMDLRRGIQAAVDAVVGNRFKKQGPPEPLSEAHFAKLKRKAGLPVDEPTEAPQNKRRRASKQQAAA
ncbi:hypothetical protein BN1708_018225, partial [Verticillium longisporum]